MSHLDTTFGVEIECYLPDGQTMAAVAVAVAQRLGAPGHCRVEGYTHGTRSWWKVVTDGSLSDVRGIELVSPVLRGTDGLQQVEIVCKALTDFGCTVSKRCGFHVHVAAARQNIDFWKNIIRLYALYEPVIDQFMPASRRQSNNMYCKSMTSANLSALASATSFEAVMRAAINSSVAITPVNAHSHRFFKVNLAAFYRHRTVEFRQHSGTLDAVKATRWTILCLRMVDRAASALLSLGAAQAINRARPGSKAHRIGEMLLRPEGVTGQEICAAMGWPSVSIPAQAKAAGIAVTSQRMGRQVRYFAVNVQAQAPSYPITIDGFVQLLGASDEERSYLSQRAADLSGSVSWAA